MNFIDRTGEVRTMNNGLKATIINYKNSSNIDIQFENGQIVCHNTVNNFIKGNIKCPMIYIDMGDYYKVTNPNSKINMEFLIDKEDLCILSNYMWYIRMGYAYNSYFGFLHRYIINAPKDMQVDHINGNKIDNRKSNLRLCIQKENLRNVDKRTRNTSGYKGVFCVKSRGKDKTKIVSYKAYISCDNKIISLGCFNTLKQAALAYNEAAKKYHGKFARLNEV